MLERPRTEHQVQAQDGRHAERERSAEVLRGAVPNGPEHTAPANDGANATEGGRVTLGYGMSDAAARAQAVFDLRRAVACLAVEVPGEVWDDVNAKAEAVLADLDRVTREHDSQEKVLAACARLLGDEMPAWEPLPVRELGCASCVELAAAHEREQQLRELAKSAKSVAAAPDYDEEAIRDALWALVDAVLAEGRTE